MCYKRFNEFKNFDASLKAAFPGVELPKFPSKFALVNKNDIRQKTFNVYLKRIVELCKEFSPMAKDTLMKRLGEFLDFSSMQEEHKESQVVDKGTKAIKGNTVVQSAQVDASSGTITGSMEVLEPNGVWETYYGSLQHTNLFLFATEYDPKFRAVISCAAATISDNEMYADCIDIRHECSNEVVSIRPTEQSKKASKAWKNALVISATQSIEASPNFHKGTCMGKVKINIGSLVGVKIAKPAASTIKAHVYVKVTLNPFTYKTFIIPQSTYSVWDESFILPVFNKFFSIKLEV